MPVKKSPRKNAKRIDVHSHVVPAEMLSALERDPERYEMRFEQDAKKPRLVRNDGSALPVFTEFYDAAAKVAGMDRKGLDVSLISPTLPRHTR